MADEQTNGLSKVTIRIGKCKRNSERRAVTPTWKRAQPLPDRDYARARAASIEDGNGSRQSGCHEQRPNLLLPIEAGNV